jgi:hypothetical protein
METRTILDGCSKTIKLKTGVNAISRYGIPPISEETTS